MLKMNAMTKAILFHLLMVLPTSASNVVRLDEDNIHELTKGKSVFIKFYAPWCGHCKKIAPIWEELAAEWKNSKTGLIAEVDCTEEKELCQDYEVKSYPSLLYGDPLSPERYAGSRSLEDLKEFAKENLKPYCSIYDLAACTKQQKKAIEALKKKALSDLLEEEERVEQIMADAQAEYDKEMEIVNKKHDEMVETFNKKMDDLRDNTHYTFIEQILFEFNEAEEAQDEL